MLFSRKTKPNPPQKDTKLPVAPAGLGQNSTPFNIGTHPDWRIPIAYFISFWNAWDFTELTMMLFAEVFDKVYQLVLFQAFWFARRESNQIWSIEFAYF